MKKCKNLPKKINSDPLTEREKSLLNLIVEEYINTAAPVGSNFLLESNKDINLSSATIRNVMSSLEKKGYLGKYHTSSGRVPSIEGFKYYEQSITKFSVPRDLKNKLSEIFKKRTNNIDEVVSESVKLISEILELPTIVTSIHEEATLKKIELIQLSEHEALLILVFSDASIIKNEINFLKKELINDISICVSILNDRLLNLKSDFLLEQLDVISNLIKQKVQNYEFIMQEVLVKIFNKKLIKYESDVISTKNLLKQKEFHDFSKLNSILSLLDNTSIWEYLAVQSEKDKSTKITFGNEINSKEYSDIAIASASIKTSALTKKQISIIGPTRMKYKEVISLLNFIKAEIEKDDEEI